MSRHDVIFIDPPSTLKERVCAADDGASIEDLLAGADAIVARTAAQWRMGAMTWIESLAADIGRQRVGMLDAGSEVPSDIGSVLQATVAAAHEIEEQASALGFPGIRKASQELGALMLTLGNGTESFGRRLEEIEKSIERLLDELAVGTRAFVSDLDWMAAAD